MIYDIRKMYVLHIAAFDSFLITTKTMRLHFSSTAETKLMIK